MCVFFQELGCFLAEKEEAFLCIVTGPVRGMHAEGVIPGTGWGKSKLTVVPMENNTILSNNTRIKPMLHEFTTANLLLPHPLKLPLSTSNSVFSAQALW